MGSCLSSSSEPRQPTANVVSPSGDLHSFETPVIVADVLLHLNQISSSSHSRTFFLCNSDRLSYEDQIPAMSSDEELIENQIYFVFPISSLNRRLSTSEMAALAVTASLAINNSSKPSISLFSSKPAQDRRRVKNKISPYMEPETSSGDVDSYYNYATVKSGGLARSSSLKKLQRYSSKRAKLAIRSFRLRLSTIHEGSVAQFF